MLLRSHFTLGVGLVKLVGSQTIDIGQKSNCGYVDDGYGPEGYYCAPYKTTETVYMKTTISTDTTTSSAGEPSAPTEEPPASTSTQDGKSPSAGSSQPTTTQTRGSGDDVDPPNLGTEHDLSSRQRVDAGVGSGVSGGSLDVADVRGQRQAQRGHRQQFLKSKKLDWHDGPLASLFIVIK
ncbi:hypothetical protein FGRMN_2727 [Fusarium graminum]|nr:hypothetical protein FGRMN_2727 [Fusarium graminum]